MTGNRKHFINTLCDLLAADEPADPFKHARWLWLRVTAAKWTDAQRRCIAAWDRVFAGLPDDLSEEELDALHLDPPEQAEEDALWQQLDDVIQKDLWPKELYWGGI